MAISSASSTSTLINVTAGYFSAKLAKKGAIATQGPHLY